MKILLTAFDPFGGESINPAQEVAAALPERIGGAEIVKLWIPTVFDKAAEMTARAMDELRPDAVVSLGQAGGRKAVTPERIAINWMDARIPDNAGQQPVDAPIVPSGPAAYFATVPVKDMVRAIQEAGVPSELSNSAGTYVCNHLLYCVLHHAGPGVRAGFIHVPCIPEQTAGTDRPSLPLAQLVAALEAAVAACCKG